ncbi:hypothetical protein NLM24_17560 [Nocardia zapadnayensis]|uniref:hypothetical protein n=1 Tax=Nocardia rhamnosiphila TaxID=426716 RepID=UPI002246E9D8|nr:hypothetical protein [Nocardia zapadnayensis]MCX0272476.1 hypothetical protein [Nocardia zapadnayensis]
MRCSIKAERPGPGAGSRLWQERFDGYTDETSALGFDPVFQRMWQFYPAYAGARLRRGYLDVEQFVLTRRGEV